MKKTITLITFLFAGLFTFGQEKINLVIFSEDGYPFYAYVNGIKQNAAPEANVKITGLSPNVSLRLEFEDKAKAQIKKDMALEPGFEHTVRIKEDSKKQLKLRYFGQTAINDPSNSGAKSVAYHSSDNQGGYNTAADNSTGSHQTSTNVQTEVKTSSSSDPEKVNVNVNMGGVGISMNVIASDMNSTNMNSSTSTTVTSSSSSSGYTQSETRSASPNSGAAATSAPAAGCSLPMSAAEFNKMKQSVEAKPFSDTKMSTAKVATKNACLSLNQVKEICKLFSMDDDKLTYAKYAYDYCTEKSNYYQVGDVFSFSSSSEDLNAFLESK